MWSFDPVPGAPAGVLHLAAMDGGEPVPYEAVARAWRDDAAFAARFTALLADAPFEAYLFETPSVGPGALARPFELVLFDEPVLARATPEPGVFAEHLEPGAAVAVFPNLGGDAWLVAPAAGSAEPGGVSAWPHLAAFARGASPERAHALWGAVGRLLLERAERGAVWLSTNGLGVAWLHVRLDARPKYYRHAPFRRPPTG